MAYTVARGDSLSAIGAKLGVNWRELYDANKGVIGGNPNRLKVGMVLNLPGQGGGGGAPAPASGGLDLNTALNSYGFVGQLASAIPDLKGILDQAISAQWVPAQFTRAVMDSGWWKSNAESVRQMARLQATDPATYNQNWANAENKIALLAQQMGRPAPTDVQRSLAMEALLNNWDDQQLRAQIGNRFTPEKWSQDGVAPAYTGDAGQLEGHLRQVATNYGVPITDEYLRTALNVIQGGHETIEGYENIFKARAKATFPHLAAQIDAGMTVRDIADPYIATMAQTLEVPETGIKLSDPSIQRALQAKDPTTGAFSNKPMYQFQRELKDDPRWDDTKNAEQEAYRTVGRLGKDMGFLS